MSPVSWNYFSIPIIIKVLQCEIQYILLIENHQEDWTVCMGFPWNNSHTGYLIKLENKNKKFIIFMKIYLMSDYQMYQWNLLILISKKQQRKQ